VRITDLELIQLYVLGGRRCLVFSFEPVIIVSRRSS
jgi:hypothetical protein